MLDKSDFIIYAVAGVIFAAYIGSLSTTIAGGDSGEIVAEGCHLGTAHPPGYPLITMIINVISRIDTLGSVAYRVNIFCAACTVLAAVFLGKTVQLLHPSKSAVGAIIAMGMFSFSPLIWQYAITAEVFPLNTMFAALILYLVVLFSKSNTNIAIAYAGAFICGLALCNQHTIVLFEVPLIVWMLFLLRSYITANPSTFLFLSVSFIAGLLPYAYLPIASVYSPKPGSWGQVDTLSGFLHHILRKDYGTFQLFSGEQGKTAEGFGARNAAFLTDFVGLQTGLSDVKEWNDYGTACLAVVVLGMCACVWQLPWGNTGKGRKGLVSDVKKTVTSPEKSSGKAAKRNEITSQTVDSSTTKPASNTSVPESKLSLCPYECSITPIILVLTLVFYFTVFHSLSNLPLKDRLLYGIHQRFWMQPNIIMFAFMGVGVNAVLSALSHMLLQGSQKSNKNQTTNNTMKKTDKNKTDKSDEIKGTEGKVSSLVRVCVFVIHALFWSLAVYVILTQYRTWLPILDMSDNTHFKDYASAVLSPLSPNAVLLINYDQQWTSVRYMQMCEGYRTDVAALQLSMMTYPWFQYKRDLYPNLTFPGTSIYYYFYVTPVVYVISKRSLC